MWTSWRRSILDWLDSEGMLNQAHECLKKIIKNPLSVFSDCIELPDVKVGFDIELAGNGVLDVDGAASKNYASGAIPLNEEPWELPELIAGPVVLTPELDFTATVEGDAATYFHARTEFGYDLGANASVGTTSGVSSKAPSFKKHIVKPTVEVSSSGHSKASFGPRLSLLAYDTFGFSANLNGFGELEANQKNTPCWDYTVGIELVPSIRLRIPWKKFGLQKLANKLGWNLDYAYGVLSPIDLYSEHPFADAPVSERACKEPPVSALPLGEGPSSETYQNPTFSPWSYRFGNVAATQPFVSYAGQSRVIVDKTHASSWLVSGANMGSVLHLADDGSVAWARSIGLGLLPDEEKLALDPNATSALAMASDALDVFVASDRLTLLALEYDGTLKWARRLRTPSGLPAPELRELTPVAMTRIEGGDFAVLYSRRAVEHVGSQVVLLRASPTGELRFAKTFSFPSGQLSLGAGLIPIGQELVVTGLSFEPTHTLSYVMRFDANGDIIWSKRIGVNGSSRVRIESITLRASGDMALVGTYEVSPERTFFATISPSGEARGARGMWTGSILEDVSGVAVAELPTSGFVTLSRYTPYIYTGNALELSTHDSQGIRTAGKGYSLKDEVGTGIAHVAPAGLRLTTDGGALAVAYVDGDMGLLDHGLWISKLPARTFDASFDPSEVDPALSDFDEAASTLDMESANVSAVDLDLEEVDVTALASSQPTTPSRLKRTK